MSYALTKDEELLKASVADFVKRESNLERIRELREDEFGFSRELWKKMAELGWIGLIYPDENGGYDGTYKELVIVMEEIGRGLMPEPLISTALVGGNSVFLGGNEELKGEILPKMIQGDLIMTGGFAEAQSRYYLNDVCTAAKAENNHYIISGTKTFVDVANAADKFVISARTSGGQYDENGITVFLIDSGSDGISLSPRVTLDGRKRFHVEFENVKVPSSNMLGKEGEGYHLIKEVALRTTVGLTGEMLGGMEEAFDITIKYMKQRVQFNRPIGSFQALQHRCVDMWMQIQLSRSAVLESALQFDSNTDSREIAISIAKARCSNAFKLVGSEGIQMHGAIGMTDECDIGFFLKRAKVSEVTFGDADFHYEMYERLTQPTQQV